MTQNEVRDELMLYRAEHGMSQREFSVISNISYSTINKFERGNTVTNLTLAKIKNYLIKNK